MFPVKHTVIYTFFAITSVQNTCFCSVFNALASKNPAKSCYVQCFFHFWPFFHCRKATKIDPKFHFNTLLRSDTQKSSKNVENTTEFWSRCETVFGPPPAKADIATAILTNVIESGVGGFVWKCLPRGNFDGCLVSLSAVPLDPWQSQRPGLGIGYGRIWQVGSCRWWQIEVVAGSQVVTDSGRQWQVVAGSGRWWQVVVGSGRWKHRWQVEVVAGKWQVSGR